MADEQDQKGQVGQVGRVRQVGEDGHDEPLKQDEPRAHDEPDESLGQVGLVGRVGEDGHDEPLKQDEPRGFDESDESRGQVGLVGQVGEDGHDEPLKHHEPRGHDESDESRGQVGPVGQVGEDGHDEPLKHHEPRGHDESDESLGQVGLVGQVGEEEHDEPLKHDEPRGHDESDESRGQVGLVGQVGEDGHDEPLKQDEPLESVGPVEDDGSPGQVGQAPDDAAIESGGGDALRASAASAELKAILEALIFASPDPLTRRAIGKLLTSEPAEDIDAALAELKVDYERPGGLQLVEVAGGYQIVTRSHLHEWVRRLFHERTTQKLTVQALETLAVIAYRQPVTALEVTEIRGVTAAGVLNTLLERHLIKIVGRKKVVGRPFLYATTKEFLIRFGLNEITDLPRVEDMAEALGFEPPLLIEHAPIEEALPLDEPDPEPDGPLEEEPSKIH